MKLNNPIILDPIGSIQRSARTLLLLPCFAVFWVHDLVAQTSYSNNANGIIGWSNVGIGSGSMSSNVSGAFNTAIGYQSLAANEIGIRNTANGFQAMLVNKVSSFNTAIGCQALANNTTGERNTALGDRALLNNQTGGANTGIGAEALVGNMSGRWNTATGAYAMSNNQRGNCNAAVGNSALGDNLYGNYNTGVGFEALRRNIGGQYNTALGVHSAFSNTTGEANTALGVGTLYGNTSGSYNTAGGHQAMRNENGQYNTAFGALSLYTNNSSYNTALGAKALGANTNGSNNTAVGFEACGIGSAGGNNTAVGYQALRTNSGGNNSALGWKALQSNAAGAFNTACGHTSLFYNVGGNYNTGVGTRALINNTSGNQNTAVGYYSLRHSTTQSNNTALGYLADVSSNTIFNATAIGQAAIATASNSVQLGNGGVSQVFAGVGTNATLITGGLQVLGGSPSAGKVLTCNGSTGIATWQNLGTGNAWYLNGNSATSGDFIGTLNAVPLSFRVNGFKSGLIDYDFAKGGTFMGFRSGESNAINGTGNTAYGYNTLAVNTIGSQNTVVGFTAMDFNVNGGRNTAVGVSALGANLNGFDNTAIGLRALEVNGSGSGNTALGSEALSVNTIGVCNTAVGMHANVGAPTLSNATAIGYNAIVNTSDQIQLGPATTTHVATSGTFNTVSDGRFKTNIRDEVKGLAFIQKLRPVVYNFDTRRFTQFLTQNMPDSLAADYLAADFAPSTAIRQSGFIAQEVEQAAKEVGYNFNGVHVPADENDNYSLAYAQFVVPLVKGMQEQQAMIEAQQAQIAELQTLVHTLTQTCCAGAGTQADAPKSAQAQASATTPAETAHPVEVFPNPSQGHFTVRIAPLEAGYMEVFDLRGVKVHRQDLVAGQTEYTIDLSGQASGSYLLRLQSHCGTVATKQLVIE